MKQKKPQIGDLVGIVATEVPRDFYTDGRAGNPMREALEVL